MNHFLFNISLATGEVEVPLYPGGGGSGGGSGGAQPPPEIVDVVVPAWEKFIGSCESVIDYSLGMLDVIVGDPIMVLFLAGSIIPIGLSIIRIMRKTAD